MTYLLNSNNIILDMKFVPLNMAEINVYSDVHTRLWAVIL